MLWNLLTAALLPVALADAGPFRPALRRGLAASRAGVRRWAPALVGQMLLLGCVTFTRVSYTTRETKSAGAEYASTETQKTNSSLDVHSVWTGGYADSCKRHESLMKSLEAEPSPPVEFLLTLLSAVLAVVIKFRIIGDLYRPAPVHEAPPLAAQEVDEWAGARWTARRVRL